MVLLDGTAIAATSASIAAICSTTVLPPNAVISFDNGAEPFTLSSAAVLAAPCPVTLAPRQASEDSSPTAAPTIANVTDLPGVADVPTAVSTATVIASDVAAASDDSSLSADPSAASEPKYSDFRDPFWASTFPICYALAATTVTSYMLVIMLLVTPRSFLDGGVVRLSRRSFTSSSSQGVSIGGRPILQKVAAVTVAASLTLATANTFSIARVQYHWGAQNAKVLQNEVMDGVKIKVIRIISNTFLWLAQAQTLIRLFPRQREKIIIKWVAFFLITLDVIFSGINSFKYTENGVSGHRRPHSFSQPVPALSYLFQLALGVLYAGWVIYYALMKRRFAFYHPAMKNICLVAVVSLLSIIIPIVFFILDISQPQFTVWGDYVRWVGAAAASTVVWEWVERIEALEREEKKDGILGREVFDGDDVLEVNASHYPYSRYREKSASLPSSSARTDDNETGGNGHDYGAGGMRGRSTGLARHGMAAIAHRYREMRHDHISDAHEAPRGMTVGSMIRPHLWPSRPAPVATPTSRTDTPSAASTVYAVRYQPVSEATSRTPEPFPSQVQPGRTRQPVHSTTDGAMAPSLADRASTVAASSGGRLAPALTGRRSSDLDSSRALHGQDSRRSMPGPTNSVWVNDGGDSPSSEHSRSGPEASGPTALSTPRRARRGREDTSWWDVKTRLEEFAAKQADKVRDHLKTSTDTSSLPVTVIPAPARRGAALQQVLEEEEAAITGRDAGLLSSSNEFGDSYGGASHDVERHSSSSSNLGQGMLRPEQPPLWPGVQQRVMFDDEDEEDYFFADDESLSGSLGSRGGSATDRGASGAAGRERRIS